MAFIGISNSNDISFKQDKKTVKYISVSANISARMCSVVMAKSTGIRKS